MLSCTDTPAAQQTALPLAEISSRHGRGGFNPYVNNGGTVVCVAGEDFVIGVGDTRLSVGYSIHSRHHSKITQLTSRCCIASSGMQADINTLHKLLKARVAVYRHLHRAEPSGPALSQLLSSLLYSRRFFPFYTFNLLFALDEEGKGAVFGYDAIGSFERSSFNAAGTGGPLVTALLDNQMPLVTALLDNQGKKKKRNEERKKRERKEK
ncbi:proteasome subunit beta type 1, putative [Eimeria tenella]|uniref:Proteasome subunit beta type 1, putative n=1 Tax=Eimeria tenella TaxID=5802 RepID=U6L661_EIMTE|nr:proteasome subunit beta type 1, putative [Eimeria tenella]CDJ44064.1 proteasome subunit beta type 1, putative [Eimeria tenella]|eukprot:XP_013234813.1 proteasome subunit beta type 1, putative [Eimeria tenella]